ncbi:multidrug effflux MFS transporter [Shewanella chilikensis]|uniref:multidrug effflux MFS transporter n=1 Tax=Shewanella chilikensis TaxID=558541 RepID=UPI001F1C0D3F|nr:multidrug effflux MFS transporter [Shewanella chilikensis]MCE9788914.1 multidrug effflux MFS transporter [Shewanella chilikensis]
MNRNNIWNYSFLYSLVLLVPFDLLASLGMDLYLPAVNDIGTSFKVGREQVQLTLTMYMALLGLGQLLFGPLSDKFGRRPIVVIGAVLYSLSSLAIPLSPNFDYFLGLRLLQSLSASALLVAAFATVRDVFAEREEGVVVYAIMGSVLACVPAVAPFLGALIEKQWHWQGIFYFLGIFAAVVAVHTVFKWPETRPAKTQPFRFNSLFTILGSKTFIGYTLAYATAMGTFFAYFSTSPSVLMDTLSLSKVEFSLWFGSVAIVMILTTRFVKPLVRRWGISGTVFRGLVGLFVSGLILYLCEWLFGVTLLGFMLPMYLIGVNIALTCAVSANGALHAFSASAGLATALYYALESLYLSLMVSVLIKLIPPGTSATIAVYIFISSLLAAGFILLGRRQSK